MSNVERVSFLTKNTRVECLLNPEEIEVSRTSGIKSEATIGASQSNVANPVQRTNGEKTTLKLKLLFDVSLIRSSMGRAGSLGDVRELTEPLWKLTELAGVEKVHFIWGKHWNIAGDVESLSEKLERFSVSGAPQRSWINMSFIAGVAPHELRKKA
jgi:hypothetical protein